MATIDYIDPVRAVHGKLSKKHVTAYNERRASGKNYSSVRSKSTKSPTPGQVENRERFKQAHQAAILRMQNQSTYAADMLAFSNQKKYTTFLGYLFHLEYALAG